MRGENLSESNLPEFKDKLNIEPDIIINLQGDMPNITPEIISDLVSYMSKNKCDIGTLASKFSSKSEIRNPNVVKVAVKDKLSENMFLNALDFFRIDQNSVDNLYHHVGIYAFTSKALMRYVNLKRSKLELERNLEQMRAMDNGEKIYALESCGKFHLGVDTEADLQEARRLAKLIG